ncbi:MAG: Sua5/YciO/YrdC/YwlC family protein, partial [Gemmatimonadaceae bacterium]
MRNDSAGVTIEVQGTRASVDTFIARLSIDAPPHARIDHLHAAELYPTAQARTFSVLPSERLDASTASIPADLCTCAACLAELFDPADRRYRYPFINCTDCGPRFTISRGVPYDRAATTMAAFTMCDACQREYDDPGDRRFHAQPNACPVCGPHASLVARDGAAIELGRASDAVSAAADALRRGAIVAVKGLGGYHLACRANDDAAVQRLRVRKRREAKPFAVMVASFAAALELVHLEDDEQRMLQRDSRPIVLARARSDAPSAPSVAPGRTEIGVMLPYTPLHHLLLADVGAPLVMTSGNVVDEPIAFRDDDALERLSAIADLCLVHDRAIEARCEDSVMRIVSIAGVRQPMFIRRSRGYVPDPVTLPMRVSEPVLAVGGQLKNTAAIARGD